jgi:leucyl-tRNA synthetase
MVMSPEHPLVDTITTDENKAAVEAYKEAASKKSDLDRTDLAKDKSGQFTGAYAINPVNGEKIPIWISDYVLISYGTGAIMSVPAHDERDFEFATKFKLPIIQVVQPDNAEDAKLCEEGKLCFAGDGTAINSGEFTGLSTPEFVTGCSAVSGTGASRSRFCILRTAASSHWMKASCRLNCRNWKITSRLSPASHRWPRRPTGSMSP